MKKQLLYFVFLNVACIAFCFFILPTLPELMPRHTNGVNITSYEAKTITNPVCYLALSNVDEYNKKEGG
ncbi:hypothetical protein [Brochothrix campestris]|uniref:Uncharacterized protein n=1 Tax=Brochothrix campestris FSL F6-1037 TaxID=1265861 RepID=W7CFU9_9LIST|nr:hypothetical protein [Brochothrix campestris]EUJ34736.1 hypothetical protein BCAMP_12125 [Brochothrix campestris FSL F6-1037]